MKPHLMSDDRLDFPIARAGRDAITRQLVYKFNGSQLVILATDHNVWCQFALNPLGEFLPYAGENFSAMLAKLLRS